MYLPIDIESGGVDPLKCSLLTGYMEVLDKDLNPISLNNSLSFALKHDIYRVSGKALEINKINLVEHDRVAESNKTVTAKVNAFLHSAYMNNNKQPLILVGHNVHFDAGFMKAELPGVDWNTYISYRHLDTQPVAMFLQSCGLIHSSTKTSLRSLAAYFGIEDNNAHTAAGDVAVTIQVLKALQTAQIIKYTTEDKIAWCGTDGV